MGTTKHRIDGEIVGGNDNYFNHTIYNSGWAYHNFIIGTPLITSPIIDHLSSGQILINNKVVAHHLGMKGWIEEQLQYKAMFTYSMNYGRNGRSFIPVKQEYSFLSEFHYQLPKQPSLRVNLRLAADFGNMYGKNVGMLLGVVYRGMTGG